MPAGSARRTGLILLFAEKRCHPTRGGIRRACAGRSPDSGLRASPPPSRVAQWLVGACRPLQWRNRPRFSRGSRAPAHGPTGHTTGLCQRSARAWPPLRAEAMRKKRDPGKAGYFVPRVGGTRCARLSPSSQPWTLSPWPGRRRSGRCAAKGETGHPEGRAKLRTASVPGQGFTSRRKQKAPR